MIAYGREPDALDPFAHPARHESMAGHPAGALRGAAVSLACLAAFWGGLGGVLGGLIFWVNR